MLIGTKDLESQHAIAAEVEGILQHALDSNNRINWNSLKSDLKYSEPKPQKGFLFEIPRAPQITDRPPATFGWLDKLFPSMQRKELERIKGLFVHDYSLWEKENAHKIAKNQATEEKFTIELSNWEKARAEYISGCNGNNRLVDNLRNKYQGYDSNAICDYCKLVLSKSKYPYYFPHKFELDYNSVNKIIVIDYLLPSVEDLPRAKGYNFIQRTGQYKATYLSESAFNKLYDSVIYQITLRTIYELFKADDIDAIAGVVFNGLVDSVDKATGNKILPCIISIQVSRNEFTLIDLSKVDPKACFRHLKGVSSSKLHSLTSIAPVIYISRADKRFVPSYDVANALDNTVNLAAMDWEDFEHLIRELFEKEFSVVGGEVKITRASRDSGVDAVAFDPDPIRGGKIVIQAKRYTNTVGVSAVRDLYGTVMNEGATKGILVTTTDYGPDAYGFAKGKPLTLLNGSNLLHLLEKHGHKAMIDVQAAKKVLKDANETT